MYLILLTIVLLESVASVSTSTASAPRSCGAYEVMQYTATIRGAHADHMPFPLTMKAYAGYT